MKALLQHLECAGLNSAHLVRAKRHASSDVFLEIHQHKIHYRSLKKVCVSLGVHPGRGIEIPFSSLSSLQEFKAALYAAWIATHDELYISRQRLTSLFGVSEDTLRRWEKRIGINVTYNVVKVHTADLEASQPYIPQDARLDQFDRLGQTYFWVYRGATYYRTVNQYQAHEFIRCRRGNTRKVAKAVNQAEIPVSDHGDGIDQSDQPNRVFFSNASTPQRYQERSGACMRGTTRSIRTPRGSSNLWAFSTLKPVSNNWILTENY